MTWRPNSPRGDLLPVDERPRIQGNWDYIETEMQDDHFFDEDSDHDGHHKIAAMTNLADTGITLDSSKTIGIDSVEPASLPTSTEGMYYVRPKTSRESLASQTSEPFYMMNDGSNNIYTQLGFRAIVLFTISGASIDNNGNGDPWVYQHNVSNVERNGASTYTITFTRALPTANYIVLGMTEAASGSTPANNTVSVANGGRAVGSVQIRTGQGNPPSIGLAVIGG